MSLQVVDQNNKKVSEIDVSKLASDKVNKAVLYYAVKAARNGLRRGTASAKDRSDVCKTNKKIYKQKGTGNARHASRKANIFVGGGSAHGPKPRSYVEKVNKKFKKASYREVIKYLLQTNNLKVVKDLVFDKPSAKQASKILSSMSINKALVVLPQDNINGVLSFRNLKNVAVAHDNNISVYDFLKYETVVMTDKVFETIKGRYCV